MVRSSAFGAILAIGMAGLAAGAQVSTSPVVAAPPVAVVPAPQPPPPPPPPPPTLSEAGEQPTVPALTRYLNRPEFLNFCTAQVALFNHREADMIFIGDSITQGWRNAGKDVWDANFGPRNALDFGISGDRTQHVLWRMDAYPIQHLHPKVAVVLIGTNNVHDTAEAIAAGVKAVLTKTQTMFPGIKIILVSIMPNRRANALMMATDEILKTYADNQSIYYLDLVPLMTPIGDNWKGLSGDHLHPDAAGYQLWADAMMPLLNKLLPPPVTAPQP